MAAAAPESTAAAAAAPAPIIINFPLHLTFPFNLKETLLLPDDEIINTIEDLENARPGYLPSTPESNNLYESLYNGVYHLCMNASFTIAGYKYKVLRPTGNPSSYGIGYLVERTDSTTGAITNWFLKTFGNYEYNPMDGGRVQSPIILNGIKEAITQSIINDTTRFKDHDDCEYTPECFVFTAKVKEYNKYRVETGKETYRLFILQFNYAADIHGYTLFDGMNGGLISNDDLQIILVNIARKLYILWHLYQFNHGDLHLNNIFIVPGTDNGRPLSPRFIDFGLSIMRIGGSYYGSNAHGIKYLREGRDLSYLASYLRLFVRTRTHIENFIVDDTQYAALSIINPRKPYKATLQYFNDPAKDNRNAYPEEVLKTFPQFIVKEGREFCNPGLYDRPGVIVEGAGAGANVPAVGGAGGGSNVPAVGGAGGGAAEAAVVVPAPPNVTGGARKRRRTRRHRRQMKRRNTRRKN
jgi:hypothetical protein